MSHLLTPRPSSPSPLRPILPPSPPPWLRLITTTFSAVPPPPPPPPPPPSLSLPPITPTPTTLAGCSSNTRLLINSNQINTATQMIHGGRNSHDLNRTTMLNDGAAIIRTCSDCNTTKTPLWRSGPRGPKSLCNACGIRQRKARRAMAEAAAMNGGIPCGGKSAAIILKTNKAVQHKIMTKPAAKKLKRKRKDDAVVAGGGGGCGGKKGCFENIKMGRRLSEISSSYQRVFPQDEREAAILLMTLSYGLLHG
ncbi:GATA transcription factor 21-like isoform X2 [Cucurbita moschata]|uniref:GATA transcription factor 21-like isoform X2 n=1 Tax=Cucurbita moschata TaxID=3662 RepID=A0A6J1HB09_CUCMO|nr:GATA transcription factor 21-like isoform X2 [Cucurbita moschata]